MSAALLVFVASIGLLLVRNIKYNIILLGLEGLFLCTMVWMSGPITWAKFVIGLLTLVIKAVVIPLVMYRMVQEWPLQYRRDRPLSAWAYVAGALLLLTITHVIQVLAPTGIILHKGLFFYGLSSIYLALLQLISRRHLLSQAGALVAAENAFVIFATSLAGNLPMFMEIGMLVDLLIASIILVRLSRLVHGQFNTTDVTALRFLRR